MDNIKSTIDSLAQTFSERMSAFENELKKKNAPQEPSLQNLSAEFEIFRSFVVTTFKHLEMQVTLLSMECDSIEMRSRRGMLLLHGVPESKEEDSTETFLQVTSEHLAAPQLVADDVVRAMRLGRVRQDKPRPLLVKLRSEAIRDNLWLAKKKLKGSGITMSEFMTKLRHKILSVVAAPNASVAVAPVAAATVSRAKRAVSAKRK